MVGSRQFFQAFFQAVPGLGDASHHAELHVVHGKTRHPARHLFPILSDPQQERGAGSAAGLQRNTGLRRLQSL
jgi:hypothetical protein